MIKAQFVASVKEVFCRVQLSVCNEAHDIIKSILADVIDTIPTRTATGERGWLTENFMKHFGWD